jgi:hypothetical protein
MEYLFLALTVLFAAGLALGLFRPGLVMPGGNRARALLGYGLATAVFLVLFVMTADSSLWRGGPAKTPATAPAPSPARKNQFSRLDIATVVAESGRVTVTGSTDLPDGSLLSVDFDVSGPPDNESDMAVGEEATVEGGRYTVTITPPRTPAFARGPYVVTVLFSPRVQTGEVLRRVGKDGENLAGPGAAETFGFKVLQARKEVSLKL